MNATHVLEEVLEKQEVEIIEGIINKLIQRFHTIEQEEFATQCHLAAHEIPYRLRKVLNDFRNQRVAGGHLVVKGFVIDQEAIGPTPSHWDAPWENTRTLREEIFQCLISSALGDIFGWLTQENGRFLRHIVPIEADKNEQLGGSSNVTLLWHVEEAFHPQRAEMMTIMCYRNEEQACTNICSTCDLNIPAHYRKILSEPRFIILPDKSHFKENNISSQWNLDEESFEKIRHFLQNPKPTAILNGQLGRETILIDEAFIETLPGDLEAREALDWLFAHMNEQKHAITMKPGDLLLIDNRITAHGRSPYKPNYGPHARWLRRVNITADLVKSYQWKEKPSGRTIF
ncbi:MAG: TauD/TfdA family dioxygenase [Chlamydiia bacterium]